jgi:lysophospholipase L1-like esterase
VRSALALLLVLAGCAAERPRDPLQGVTRVLFLGDSITYDGTYVVDVEACLRANAPARELQILNLGLPSETVSGLSEPDHAGGAFPRPALSERLARVLAAERPDLVVACYGMNDGIYLPFDEQRFARFREGIENLRADCVKAGARVLLLSPPVFDGHGPVDYDAVLRRYSDWLVGQRKQGWEVVDIHAAMSRSLAIARGAQPDFSYAPDGVHPDEHGHWVMARALLPELGVQVAESCSSVQVFLETRGVHPELLELVRDRQRIERDSQLAATGHLRPGLPAGFPPEEARYRAMKLEGKLRGLLSPASR